MNTQFFGSMFSLANIHKINTRILSLLLLVSLTNACEFISKESKHHIPKSNPGENSSLAGEFADTPSDNSHRMLSAVKQIQNCSSGLSCSSIDKDYITYTYTGDYLTSVVEESNEPGAGGIEITSQREYIYDLSNPDRLDKVAVRKEGNFHTLHDYTYDDEDDGDFKAITTNNFRPKLRKEYICDINLAAVTTETCTRDNAAEVINYIYYADGHLYRKEFDVNNDTKIDHQKIYHYDGNVLERVDTDNFYNGKIDERYSYENTDDLGLRVYIDKDYLTRKTRGTDLSASYKLDYLERYNADAGDTSFAYNFYISNDSELLVTLNETELAFPADYTVNNNAAYPYGGTIVLSAPTSNGDDIEISAPDNGYDNVISKECYFNKSTANSCKNTSTENFHWNFVWEQANCWAGGLDDIDPEARAIEYLCKQKD